jgi:hypothetical protein
MNEKFCNISSITAKASGKSIELLPCVDELFELEMAWLEFINSKI